MKTSALLALATMLAAGPSLAVAQTQLLSYSGTVTLSTAGMPAVGSAFNAWATYSNDPAASTPNAFSPAFATYDFRAPFEFVVDLGTSTFRSSNFGVAISDNALYYGPQAPARDFFEIGAKFNAISYLLALDGPTSSFAGNLIPSPDLVANFWQTGSFGISDMNFVPLLRVDITRVTITPVPEPSTLALWACGAGALLGLRATARARRVPA